MAVKTKINIMLDTLVNAGATDVTEYTAIVDGKRVSIKHLGFSVPRPTADTYAALQWGDASGGWTTIRAGVGNLQFESDHEFVGNGVKKFRVVRKNGDAAQQRIFVWADAVIHDV